jgi:hypothetical protein
MMPAHRVGGRVGAGGRGSRAGMPTGRTHREDPSRGHQLHRPDRPGLAGPRAGWAAAEIIRIAVIASVIGWLVVTALQPRATRHQSGAAPAT